MEFDGDAFARDLARRLGHEFVGWAVYLRGLVEIRAFALWVSPFDGEIRPSLLTDCEHENVERFGPWALGDWRLHSFTASPDSPWPYGATLGDQIKAFVDGKPLDHAHPEFAHSPQPHEAFEVLVACAKALQEPEFQQQLRRFDLSDDFELGVFHGDDERHRCNFAREANQDLSVLVRVGDG